MDSSAVKLIMLIGTIVCLCGVAFIYQTSTEGRIPSQARDTITPVSNRPERIPTKTKERDSRCDQMAEQLHGLGEQQIEKRSGTVPNGWEAYRTADFVFEIRCDPQTVSYGTNAMLDTGTHLTLERLPIYSQVPDDREHGYFKSEPTSLARNHLIEFENEAHEVVFRVRLLRGGIASVPLPQWTGPYQHLFVVDTCLPRVSRTPAWITDKHFAFTDWDVGDGLRVVDELTRDCLPPASYTVVADEESGDKFAIYSARGADGRSYYPALMCRGAYAAGDEELGIRTRSVEMRPHILPCTIECVDSFTGDVIGDCDVEGSGGIVFDREASRFYFPPPFEPIEEAGIEITADGYETETVTVWELAGSMSRTGILRTTLTARQRNVVLVWPLSQRMSAVWAGGTANPFIHQLREKIEEQCGKQYDFYLRFLTEAGLEKDRPIAKLAYVGADLPEALLAAPCTHSIYNDDMDGNLFDQRTVVVGFVLDALQPTVERHSLPVQHLEIINLISTGSRDDEEQTQHQNRIKEGWEGIVYDSALTFTTLRVPETAGIDEFVEKLADQVRAVLYEPAEWKEGE